MKKCITVLAVFAVAAALACGKGNENTARNFYDEVMKLYNEKKITHTLKEQKFITREQLKLFGVGEGMIARAGFDFHDYYERETQLINNEFIPVHPKGMEKFSYLGPWYYFEVYETERFAQDAVERLKAQERTDWEKYGSKEEVIHKKNMVFHYNLTWYKEDIKQQDLVIQTAKKYMGIR